MSRIASLWLVLLGALSFAPPSGVREPVQRVIATGGAEWAIERSADRGVEGDVEHPFGEKVWAAWGVGRLPVGRVTGSSSRDRGATPRVQATAWEARRAAPEAFALRALGAQSFVVATRGRLLTHFPTAPPPRRHARAAHA